MRAARDGHTASVTPARTVLLTGATGYVGGCLLPALLDQGHRVRCLVRDRSRAGGLDPRAEVVEGDVATGDGLGPALRDVEVAYYLVHSMATGTTDFARRDREAAQTFGRAVAAARVGRTIYLGGLEDTGPDGSSEHLRSRNEVAEVLAGLVPELVHVRAAMVVGAGSASFLMLRSLVERLPVMLGPRWMGTRTQPVAIADVVRALGALATLDDVPGEVQLGGADVLSYGEMLRRYAVVSGRRPRPVVPVPVVSPRLSSYWVGLVTPVDRGLAQPLVEGLGAETIVRDPPPPGINDAPQGFDDAVRAALSG